MSTEVLGLEDVSVTYSYGPLWDRRVVHAVRNVSLTVSTGEIFGLVGELGVRKNHPGANLAGLVAARQRQRPVTWSTLPGG